MSAAVVALVAGTVLAIGALAYVLYPIFFGSRSVAPPSSSHQKAPAASAEESLAVTALREIEFDRATGKLSDADYVQLKDRYTREALATMREGDRASAAAHAVAADEVEAAILAWRARHPECETCGPRPETDALFCSNCGRYLRAACTHCGARVEEHGARFCRECGHGLAA